MLKVRERYSDINRLVEEMIDQEFTELIRQWPYIETLLPSLKDYIMHGGKRIRPLLTLLGYRAFNREVDTKVMQAAISTEFMHTSFLIHDDLYDDVPNELTYRRGGLTLHLKYLQSFPNSIEKRYSNWEPNLFTKHAAVTSAHIMLCLGAKLISCAGFDAETTSRALSTYWQTTLESWIGQGMDILSKAKPIDSVSFDEIRATEQSRAGVYTIEFPLFLGAILAGAPDDALQHLRAYARPVGLAFEVYDDVLAVFGDEADLGKKLNDIIEGKRTLLLQHALASGSPEQKRYLYALLEQKQVSKSDLTRLREILVDTRAFETVQAYISTLITQGIDSLSNSGLDRDIREELTEIAWFVAQRKN